jgi:predicted metal-dependent TIM-barrel fold hydrolase
MIESLQHQNKVLKIELETYKLMEMELETCKSIINNMADGMVVESSDTPKTTNELVKNLERKCQCCVKLELEIGNITFELKTAREILEVLKEELDIDKAVSERITAQNT